MSTTALDIAAVRARFSALDRRLAFFDGPGGTQCPDEVIDAIARYLREDNANIGAPYETSLRTTELVELAHEKAASFLGCSSGETAFGQSMTALNFLLSRAFARTLREGDEIVVTALDHDANVSPWLELAHDLGLVVHVAGLTDDLALDYDDLASEALRPNAGRRIPGRCELGRDGAGRQACRRAGAFRRRAGVGGCRPLRAARPDRRAPHGTSTSSSARRTSTSGRTWDSRSGSGSCSSPGAPTRCDPPRTSRSGIASSSGRASTSCSRASSRQSTTWPRSDGTPCSRTSVPWASASSPASRRRVELYGIRGMEGRVPTFCFNVPGHSAEQVAVFLAEREIAVWHGDYYAVETMKHLGLSDGAVRAGIVHYNTEDEVDRLLDGLAALA